MKIKPKYKIHEIIRVADLKKTFSKSDTTGWSYQLCKTSKIIIDTTPNHRPDDLPERYNETLLKKTELTMKEKKRVMK